MRKLTKDDILQQVVGDKNIINICRNITGDHPLYKDLYQELILACLEYPEEKLLALHHRGELHWFLIGIINIMWKSPRSPFYRHFRKSSGSTLNYNTYSATPDDFSLVKELEQDFAYRIAEAELKNMAASKNQWYQAAIFKQSINCSNRKLAEATGIERRSIAKAISEARKHLKKVISKKTQTLSTEDFLEQYF